MRSDMIDQRQSIQGNQLTSCLEAVDVCAPEIVVDPRSVGYASDVPSFVKRFKSRSHDVNLIGHIDRPLLNAQSAPDFSLAFTGG